MSSTNIEWTDATWNSVTGCTKVSDGCRFCYAEVVAKRFWATQYPDVVLTNGTVRPRRFTDVQCHDDRLSQPLRWRKPRRIFVNSVSDLFHKDVPLDFVAAMFGVMASTPRHTYQILTKRPELALEFFVWVREVARDYRGTINDAFRKHLPRKYDGCAVYPTQKHGMVPDLPWPPPNVWLGVSVEDQATADARIPMLLRTPAALRFVSYEPALSAVDFTRLRGPQLDYLNALDSGGRPGGGACIDWIIVGGESGPGAREFDAQWARDTITQCRAAGLPCFVKQLGAKPFEWETVASKISKYGWGKREEPLNLASAKGGDMAEWPEDLRVREFPELAPRYA